RPHRHGRHGGSEFRQPSLAEHLVESADRRKRRDLVDSLQQRQPVKIVKIPERDGRGTDTEMLEINKRSLVPVAATTPDSGPPSDALASFNNIVRRQYPVILLVLTLAAAFGLVYLVTT